MTRTTSSDRTEVVLSSRKHDQHSQIQIRGDLNLPFPDTLDIGISDEPKKKESRSAESRIRETMQRKLTVQIGSRSCTLDLRVKP